MSFEKDEIRNLLLQRPTAALRVCVQPDVVADSLAQRIQAANEQLGEPRLTLGEVATLAARDYRLIARAIHARYHAAYGTSNHEPNATPPPRIQLVDTWEDLRNGDGLTMILHDRTYERELVAFLEQCTNLPGPFIEAQFDVPTRNAVFRDGVVKSWSLPYGTPVVSKRDNRRKHGRFFEEQRNLSLILDRLHAEHEVCAALDDRIDAPCITISRPICILRDPATTFCYAIWAAKPGESLEELLISDDLPTESRRRHLNNCRRSLDFLFDHGIVWRDMSPRNILVERGTSDVYHFVDFEKVEVFDTALEMASRIEACRTQFCVEEFGVICPEQELLETFSDLFLPTEWNLDSDAPLPFPPRAELAAVLAGRGVDHVTLGRFNQLDREVWEVRRPRFDAGRRQLVRPGLLGFRVEHYLSLSADIDCSDYDRKTTEVLLAAQAKGRLIGTFRCLSSYADRLESSIIIAEFDAILSDGHSRFLRYPEHEAQLVCASIDAFCQSGCTAAALALLLERWEDRSC